MHLKLIVSQKSITHNLFLLSIPLALAAFTHLWNPVGFPYPDFDEGIYMRRAMHILAGQGPQEVIGSFATYDHPYFGQLFLAGALSIIGYPNSLNPSAGSEQSIETLYMAPKLLMGLLAIVDTFLIFEISQRRYNRTVALIASILFAILPFTWLLRTVWLECIQLPFILASILCAISLKSINGHKRIILILFSGVFLGIAIFTKIPAVTLIPAVLFLIFTNNNRNLKTAGLWFIPVILIPMIWPVYSIYLGQFSSWMLGIYVQSHREGISLFSAMNDFIKIDLLMSLLGIFGIVFAALKKDFLILFWVVPLLIFLSFIAGISYFHLLPIFPALCIGAARLIELSKKIPTKKMQGVLPYVIVSVVGIFGLITTTTLITTNVNASYLKAAAFLPQYLMDVNRTNGIDEKITVISDPYYLWIPQYVFHLKHDYIPFYMLDSIETNKVVFLVDRSFLDGVSISGTLKKIYNLYTTNNLQTIQFGDPKNNVVVMRFSEYPSHDILPNKMTNLIGTNHTWKSFNGTTISHAGNGLHITLNSNNTDRIYTGAVLHTQISLKERPFLLHIVYGSKSLTGNATFFAEITEDRNGNKTLWDYILNTFYTEVTNDQEGAMTPWDDLKETFYGEIEKGNDGGKILWNGHLINTSGNLTAETFSFPRFSAIKSGESAERIPVLVKLYIVPKGIGVHELTVKEISIR